MLSQLPSLQSASARKDATALGLTIDPAQDRTCELRSTGLLLSSIIPSYVLKELLEADLDDMPAPVAIERVITLITSGQRGSAKYVTEACAIWNRLLDHTFDETHTHSYNILPRILSCVVCVCVHACVIVCENT